MYHKKLGIFAREPRPGEVKTRLVPALSKGSACDLYIAFLSDLFSRLQKMSKLNMTVFYAGAPPERLKAMAPKHASLVEQSNGSLGDRMHAAFTLMLAGGGPAVIIGTDSPDIPTQYVKRAFAKLKHKDIVLGPAADGGYYLIGLRTPDARVFEGVRWSRRTTFADTLAAVERAGLSLATLPIWYDVDDDASLDVLKAMVRARKLAGRDRLRAIERAIEKIQSEDV